MEGYKNSYIYYVVAVQRSRRSIMAHNLQTFVKTLKFWSVASGNWRGRWTGYELTDEVVKVPLPLPWGLPPLDWVGPDAQSMTALLKGEIGVS